MSYNSLLENETIKSNYLAILRPRRMLKGFTLFSGSVYSSSFDYGDVYSVEADGVSLTKANNTSLSSDQFYFDYTNNVLYVRLSGGGNPNSIFLVVTYNIFVATYDAHFYSDPTDNTSRVVYYEPYIKKSPTIKFTQAQNQFGFMPTQSSSINLSNAEHFFERHLYDSSFNSASIDVYHFLGDEPEIANSKLVYSGLMSDVTYNGAEITIKTLSEVSIFDKEYRNPIGANFYNTNDFAAIDPNAVGKPVRQVYGMVSGFKPVNIDYVFENVTTSDNRQYAVCNGSTGINEITKTIQSGCTTTRTYLNNVNGLNVGDTVMLDGTNDYYVEITTVNVSPAYIEHAANAFAMNNGETLRRGFVSRVDIVQNNVKYTAKYKRDYDCNINIANNVSGFTFVTSLEANLSIPETLSPYDRVSCRVYGRTNDVTINGNALGSDDTRTGNMCKPAQIIADILKRNVGLTDSDLVEASFVTNLTDSDYALGFAIPETAENGFESYKNLLTKIFQSSLIQIYLNDSKEWSIEAVKPMPIEDMIIDSTEILDGSFSHDFDYNDIISDLIVEYNVREIADTPDINNVQIDVISAESSTAKFIHKVSKSTTLRSLITYEADASTFANRSLYMREDRQGTIELSTKNRFFNTAIADTIRIDREGQAGFNYDFDTLNSRKAKIVETEKNLRQIKLLLTDNKGVEDNADNW